ncbi:MAG: 16S rRNA (guanine(527)-N(7))-methyltransferase RsmG [Proteobacteria bacterium]|nr:16S rRNA (guanine(527)-N(7))-methyltransferase RsmG [Pseudomonadota bacterium]MBU4470735.1 16S rRNA (guanine(527)-N(7))-methyltransferase RsmG [Pseudomonadota bacterium]MCG2751537.1 16S rRNA (guanine(527)-N(7))-methyltransferase RsmG [Desulfobacteraceae bacterium]
MEKMNIPSEEWKKIVMEGAASMGIPMNDGQADQLTAHCEMLLSWNRKINLTAIIDPYEVAVKHVLDSIAPARWIEEETSVLDMGSGGGFPGIPLKILKPSLAMTLVDSSVKKVSFLKHVIRTLKLENCEAVYGRLEALGLLEVYREKYQTVVSRSFAPLDRLIPRGLPFLAPHGRIIALKGKNVDKELEEVKLLMNDGSEKSGFHPDQVSIKTEYYQLPHSDMERALVVVEKNRSV